jgi:signal transduction histidine kinase
MRGRQSLRGRLIVGAVLWTSGLFIAAGVTITHLIVTFPSAPIVFHWPFTHVGLSTVLAVALLLGGLAQVRRGISPLAGLRQTLVDIHAGRASRVEGNFPTEVAPLVADLNALLEHHDAAILRAQSKAGDLAHGLKTPLAVLAKEAAAIEALGQPDLAESIQQQVTRMQRQIDYHLAHARAAASGGSMNARAVVADSVDGLIRTVERIYAERNLTIDSSIPQTLSVRAQREDLDEMLGNLIDNACKWARRRVEVSATGRAHDVEIVVDDDGPGVPEAKRSDMLRRGVRADEASPGSGFGLAIVRDLAEVYGGSIRLDTSPLGGTRAVLTLPIAGVVSTGV